MRSLVLLPRVDLFGSVLCPYRPMCQPSSCASLIFSRRPSLRLPRTGRCGGSTVTRPRSEEHTSELQSLMRISYAVFCLKKKTTTQTTHIHTHHTRQAKNTISNINQNS